MCVWGDRKKRASTTQQNRWRHTCHSVSRPVRACAPSERAPSCLLPPPPVVLATSPRSAPATRAQRPGAGTGQRTPIYEYLSVSGSTGRLPRIRYRARLDAHLGATATRNTQSHNHHNNNNPSSTWQLPPLQCVPFDSLADVKTNMVKALPLKQQHQQLTPPRTPSLPSGRAPLCCKLTCRTST
jgi:hypothetical protein